MRITDFKKTKQGRIALFADGGFLFSVHPDTFASMGLCVGSELDEDALRELEAETELKKAKDKALTLLSYKEYTTHQLEDRLLRHVQDDAAQQAVRRMEELGLLDDDDYAVRFARDLSQRKQFGILRIRQEMRRRGLSEEQISYAVSLLEDNPEEQVRELLEKKYPAAWEDEKVKRRAFSAMVRMGYRTEDIRRVLRIKE
ncbi:MAG: regulatory protein RecX [Ruminococcaceae bacterium]|jgi:regulatory protein|nr:regulatory protein RecX [Oscillospiraceae bacterium]